MLDMCSCVHVFVFVSVSQILPVRFNMFTFRKKNPLTIT